MKKPCRRGIGRVPSIVFASKERRILSSFGTRAYERGESRPSMGRWTYVVIVPWVRRTDVNAVSMLLREYFVRVEERDR